MSPIEFVIELKCAKQLLKTYNTNKKSVIYPVLKTVITSSVYLKA
jgi:hypothetical protein